MDSDKVRGMLICVALGDALGAPHEFSNNYEYTGMLEHKPRMLVRYQGYKYGVVGQITDDTAMTLALLRSIVNNNGEWNRKDVILAYQHFASTKSCMGMGKNTRNLFKGTGTGTVRRYEGRYEKALRGELKGMKGKLEDVESNGSLMRASPLIFCSKNDVIQDCKLSNPNPVNVECSIIYVQVLKSLAKGRSRDEVIEWVESRVKLIPMRIALRDAKGKRQRDIISTKGWVVHAFYCAMYALYHFDGSVGNVLDTIIKMGGDTDTNAAIAGAVLGCMAGYDGCIFDGGNTEENIDILFSADTNEGDYPVLEEYTLRDFDKLIDELV